MIIKRIFKKIHIDSSFYFFIFLSCLSANFKNFILFLSIIIIHELGHVLMGLFLGWKLDKISIYPYGGVTKFNEDINKRLIEELLILLSGPFLQLLYFFIYYYIFRDDYFKYYNISILIFNLLPIYPLDGGKILNIILSYFLSFRLSYYLSIIISIVISFLFIFFSITRNYTFNLILMFLIVISKVLIEVKKRRYYFNKFLLERYINKYNFKKVKNVSSIKKMMRDKRHIIYSNNKYYTEKDFLKKLYR
ncbi:MAG: hypothetical protein IJN90_07225 [Bacilli bacterium]|nr:hypothetical protein [Bacilli bacterium]